MDDDARSCLTVRVQSPGGPVRVWVWPALGQDAPLRPVLLACHGWTDSGEVFGPLAKALGRRWTVVAPDAPGHGGTPWPRAERFVVAEHLSSALAVLDGLPRPGGRKAGVVLLGHSMGALTAARLAAARPAVVRHLVLEEPARATPRRSPSSPRRRAAMHRLAGTDHAGRVALARAEHPDWPEDELDPWAHSKAETDLGHLDVGSEWGEPLLALLADVPGPVTLVRGEPARGGLVSMTAARRCAAACRGGAEVVALPAGHNPRREARSPFLAVLAAVLGRSAA